MRPTVLALALVVSAAPVWAQAYSDSFSYPDGTVVPGWTEKRGDWVVAAGRVHSITIPMGGPALHSIMTKDGFNLKDTVTEITAHYEGLVNAIQAGGLCVREIGGPTHTNLVLCKVQDNSAASVPPGFDIRYVYEYSTSGIATSGPIAPIVTSSRIRLIVVNNQATILLDNDLNGTWDSSLTRTLTTQLGAGESGFLAPLIRSSGLDDFALFDAVLTATGTPNVGGSLTLNLKGKTPGAVYQAACSQTNFPGIPIDSRRIPLTPDALMVASLTLPPVFANFTGVLDGNAAGQAAINFPAVPQLAGLSFFAGFVEVAPGAPSGIAAISNDHPITILP
jgi:hypothetical protein